MDIKKQQTSSIEDLLREKETIEKTITEQFSEYVTIMFTDIAGYTSFVETYGDLTAKSLLYRHNEIIFDIIKKHNGQIIKTIGDAVMASFADTRDAVDASVAVQIALKQYNKGVEKQKKINIRIGLNAGKAIKDGGDYFGDAVNVAARIEPAGSAGQIMVSRSVYDTVKDSEDVFIRYHGEKQAKGKSQPLALYRVFLNQEEFDAAVAAEKEACLDLRKEEGLNENMQSAGDLRTEGGETGGKEGSADNADFSIQWQGKGKDDERIRDLEAALEPYPFDEMPSERDADFTFSMPVPRYDLILKVSLPVMIILGLFIYFYPQIMPGEKSGGILNQYMQAFNLLRKGNIEEARNIFLDFGEDNVRCQEGLAAIAYRTNSYDEARKYCDSSIASDVEVFYPRVIKGNILFDNGKVEQARKLYSEALKYSPPLEWQKGEAYFRMGRISSLEENPERALEYYDKAMDLDRANADIMTAKGVVLEKLGDFNKALSVYDAALKIAPDHPMANTFYRQIKRNMEVAGNKEKQERVDSLIKELLETMQSRAGVDKEGDPAPGTEGGKMEGDPWTSRPMTLFFAGNERSGALSLREGEDQFFELSLLESLEGAANIQLVDRALLDKLLEELKMSSSQLADPATRLKLGRILSARLIGNLKFLGYAGETKVYLRLTETETSSVKVSLSGNFGKGTSPDIMAGNFAQEIVEKIKSQFPVRGRITEISGNEALLNIGTVHGVTKGMIMKVLPGAAVENSLKHKSVGAVKILEVMTHGARGEIVKGADVMDSTHVVEAFSS